MMFGGKFDPDNCGLCKEPLPEGNAAMVFLDLDAPGQQYAHPVALCADCRKKIMEYLCKLAKEENT